MSRANWVIRPTCVEYRKAGEFADSTLIPALRRVVQGGSAISARWQKEQKMESEWADVAGDDRTVGRSDDGGRPTQNAGAIAGHGRGGPAQCIGGAEDQSGPADLWAAVITARDAL